MKQMKQFLCLGAAALMLGCAPQQPSDQFTLDGTIDGADGEYIYLYYQQNDTVRVADSTLIEKGAFRFAGKLEQPCTNGFICMGDSRDYRNPRMGSFYLEPKKMTMQLDTAGFRDMAVTGSLTQAQVDTLQQSMEQIRKEAEFLYKALETERDYDKRDSLQELLAPYQEQIRQAQITFIQTHPNSYASPVYLQMLMSKMPYDEIKALYDSFSDEVKKYGDVERIENELKALQMVRPGAPAPEINKEDVNGKMVSLSSLKGNVVLLDFWASWCVPCRKSFPHVKSLYKKYHKDGFEVFCVADNDGTPDKWREAIKQDGLEKFTHVLRGLRQYKDENGHHQFDRSNDVSENYAVHFLPTKYLLDREGKIIGKMTDEELDVKLKEIFGR